MSGLIYQSQKRAEPLILPADRDTRHNTNQQIICYPNSHLRSDRHVKIPMLNRFVKFNTQKVSRSGNHIVEIAIDLPAFMKGII